MTIGRSGRVLLIGLGTAIVPLDTAVNIAFPPITRAFALPLAEIQWLVVAYTLTYAALLLAMGRIGDLAGHGTIFRAGLLWSAAALIACAAAPSYALLLAARFAQGIGSALVLACGPALLTALYDERERARALGLYTLMFSLGIALGPLLGGVLIARWGWPAVFWFRAPLALAAFLLYRVPEPARRSEAARERFDLAGAALLALALAALLLAIHRLGTGPSADPWALLCAASAAACFAGFIRQERRTRHPIIDLSVFRRRGFALVHGGSVLVNLASFAVLLLVPYELARVAKVADAAAGAVLAISGVATVVGSPLGVALVRRLGTRSVTTLGALLTAAGLALIAAGAGALGGLVLGLALQGLGLGLFQFAYMEVVTGSIAQSARGVAGSLALLTRTIGIVFGASLLSLAYARFEAHALAEGSAALPAFLHGFRFTLAGAAALAALAAAAEAALLLRR